MRNVPVRVHEDTSGACKNLSKKLGLTNIHLMRLFIPSGQPNDSDSMTSAVAEGVWGQVRAALEGSFLVTPLATNRTESAAKEVGKWANVYERELSFPNHGGNKPLYLQFLLVRKPVDSKAPDNKEKVEASEKEIGDTGIKIGKMLTAEGETFTVKTEE
jgi:hypothetical protein